MSRHIDVERDDRDADDPHWEPSPERQLEILWNERQWRLRRQMERGRRLRIYVAWLSGAAALGGVLSTIIGNIPWPKKPM